MHEFEGVLLIDKPRGITSHDVVDRVRRKLRMKRVGHAGTLDPMARGLLIILAGRATKLSQHLTSLDKVYEGVFRLGRTTDSHDCDGETVDEKPVPEISEEELKKLMESFLGDQYQTPPMFSAKKVEGVPLYKLARKGKTVEREPRLIRISAFDLEAFEPPLARFRMACSKGTYVRTVAHELGQKIGCGAHLDGLTRMAIEHFHLEDAVPLEEFEEMPAETIRRRLIPPYQAVPSHLL